MLTGAMTLAMMLSATVFQAAPPSAPGPGSVSVASIRVQVVGSGRPMILIPGFLSSGDVWNGVVEHYKSRFECHVVTVAGFAGVASPGSAGLRAIRDDVIAYAAARKLEKPAIVGHSMGGFLALWIAATKPDLPGSVVTVDGVPFLPALQNPSATVESFRTPAVQMKALYESMTPQQLALQTRMAL